MGRRGDRGARRARDAGAVRNPVARPLARLGAGLLPLDAATQVAIPEFDGRIIAGLISFKERDAEGSPVGAPVPHYVPDPERCGRRAARGASRAAARPAERATDRDVLTSFPTRHAPDRHGGRARHPGKRA